MKRIIAAIALAAATIASAATVELDGKNYDADVMTDREIGPGIRHTRYRLPAFPLNINVLTVDLSNPYNRIETTTANEKSRGTERLDAAGERQSSPGHRAVAGANANFWVVSSQPEGTTYTGIARNASVRNGRIVVESNQHRDQWDGGTMRTGVVGLSYDKKLHIDYCTSAIKITTDKTGTLDVHQVNKGIHDDELCMYNSFYGTDTKFMPIKIVNKKYEYSDDNDATEVILGLAQGQNWDSGRDIEFTVTEVRTNAGHGTLGSHDLALVGRGANRTALASLAAGDKVTLRYSWTYNPGSANEVTPLIEQAVGGNALVMRDGVLTEHNNNETYNSQVYSRCGYGASADGNTLYIIVIDKSTDPVYGLSTGCNTTVMCEFARWLGCSNMANFDAGGSAEMMINGKIENKTTEGTPRAVANGWLVYSIAPEDADDYNTVGRLAFDEVSLQAPVYGTFTPKVIAYNRYGAVLDYNFTDYKLSCDSQLGSCDGNVFTASGTPGKGTLRASFGDISVEAPLEVLEAQLALRIKSLLIDNHRGYPVEVQATIGQTVYDYNPADIEWNVENTAIAAIDENGVLRGISEGTTSYTGTIGSFTDKAEVTVEISPVATVPFENWADWTLKGASGISQIKLEGNKINFTYGSPRDPYVNLANKIKFYSIPDRITLEFTPSTDIRSISFDLRDPAHPKTNNISVTAPGEGVFEAGKTHTIELPVSALGNPTDLALYPLSLNAIRFYISPDSKYKGQQSITLGAITAYYPEPGSVEGPAATENSRFVITPCPVAAGQQFRIEASRIACVDIYSMSGRLVASYKAESGVVRAPATPGSYVVRVSAADGEHAAILIVK